jgi:hypothetical protein
MIARVFGLMLIASALTACGGGGGGGGTTPAAPGGSSGITVTTPTPSPSPTSNSVSNITGKAVDSASGLPLVGFTVTVGAMPSGACVAAQTPSSMPCGVPAAPIVTTTTAGDGSFSIAAPISASSMLTIGKDAMYAALHRTVTASSPALGTIKILALTADEQAWVADINMLRATAAVPTSYANLTVDEYAEEQAHAWTAGILAGTATYGDAGYGPFQAAYIASPGAIYGAAGALAVDANPGPLSFTYGTETVPAGSPGYITADAEWINGEKAACPGGNWSTCSHATGGHYVNLATTQNVWIGVGEAGPAPAYTGQWVYNVMTVLQ